MSFEVYQWSEEEKAVVTGLGLSWWGNGPIEYRGYVWLAYDADENYYVAKSIEKGSLEIKALQTMLSLPSPRNRVIPGRLFECETSYVYLMPRLERMGAGIWAPSITWDTMLDHLYAIIDYVHFMQARNISFVDISLENTVWSREVVSYGGFNIPQGQVYFIDYGSTRILPSGPGSGVKIYDYDEEGGKFQPPESTDVLDPYAYEIFALGYTLKNAFYWYREIHTPNALTHIPRSWEHFAATLRDGDPSRRPSIFRTRRQFIALRLWTSCTAWMYRISERFADNVEYYGWRIISPLIR